MCSIYYELIVGEIIVKSHMNLVLGLLLLGAEALIVIGSLGGGA